MNDPSQSVWESLRAENARLLEEVTRLRRQAQESEVRLQLVTKVISSVVIDWNLATSEYHRVNSLEEMMGYRPEEVTPSLDWTRDRIHPDDLAEFDGALQRWLSSHDEMDRLQIRCRHRDGSYRHLRGQAVMIRDPQTKRLLRIVASYRDVTSEIVANQAILESDERYRLTTAAMQGIIYDWNIITGQVHRSIGVARVFGYPITEEVSHVNWWKERVHPDDVDGALDVLYRFIESGSERGEVFYRFRHHDGHYLHIHSTFVGLRNAQGKATRVVGSMLDITPRYLAEEAQKRAERNYHLLFEDIPLGMVVIDPQLRIIECNQALADQLQYTREELIGKHSRRIAVAREWPEVPQPADFIPEDGFEFSWMKHMVRRDGVKIPIRLRGKFVRYPQYQEPCRFGVIENLTERQRAEKEKQRLEQHLQETQRLESLGVLAGGIAHDFNNLLTVILGNISLMKQDTSLSPIHQQGMQQCEDASKQAAELCRQMLAYAGRGKLENRPFQLTDLVESSRALLHSAASRHHHLHLHLSQGLPNVAGDPSQIRQILLNLVQNAAEAIAQPGGTIEVMSGVSHLSADEIGRCLFHDGHTPGDYVWLEVRDNGSGMDEATSKRVFEPFFTTKFTGRGLGLAAVAGIVRNHKGLLLHHSEAGTGTWFRVYFQPDTSNLPLAPAQLQHADSSQPQQGTILVVDDEPSVRMVLAKLLAKRGYAVIEAENGNEALELAERYHGNLRLIILDLTMPQRDGVSTLQELRNRGDSTPVLLISGYYPTELEPQLETLRARFLSKPFTAQSLLEAVAPFLQVA